MSSTQKVPAAANDMTDWRFLAPVVSLFGGRTGWLGAFYVPSLQEQADKQYMTLERRRIRLEMEQQDKEAQIRSLERRIRSHWDARRKLEARHAVKELRRERVEYGRIARQRANVSAVSSKINQLRSGTATEDALEFYVQAMSERLATTHPMRFARVLERCERIQSTQAMTDDLLEEFFADEEQADRDRDGGEEEDEDRLVDEVLVELGCIQSIEQAPKLVERQ
jgi:hypothetical protein